MLRIRKDIIPEINGSESSIGRVLCGFGIQQIPKVTPTDIKIILSIPQKISKFQESHPLLELSRGGSAKLLIILLFRDELEQMF